MTQDQLILLGFKVTLIAGEVATWLWIGVYTYLANWWRQNPIGATVVRFAIYIGVLYIPSILSLFFHLNRTTSLVAGWFDVAVFAVVAVELFRRVPLWIRLHLRRDGQQSYSAIGAFISEVIRRRGRPVWKDQEPSENGKAEDA